MKVTKYKHGGKNGDPKKSEKKSKGIDYSGRDEFSAAVKKAAKSAQMSVQEFRNRIMGTDKVAKLPSLMKKSKGAPSKTNKGVLLKKGSKIDYSGAKAFKDAVKKSVK